MSSRTENSGLPRVLGFWGVTAVMMGIIIGSGIFRTPTDIAGRVASPWTVLGLWVLGGLLSLCGAFTFAELATMFPQSGGVYVFLREGYGPYGRCLAFVFGWTYTLISKPFAAAGIAIIFGQSVMRLFGVDAVGGADAHTRMMEAKAITSGVLVVLTVINVMGVRLGTGVASVLTVIKVAALLAITGLAFSLGSPEHAPFAAVALEKPQAWYLAAVAAMSGILWTYDGWSDVGSLAGEIREVNEAYGRVRRLATSMRQTEPDGVVRHQLDQLMAAAAALFEPEAIRFPVVKGDEIASLAATCAANGFDVDETDLLDARPFVAATMALTMRLQERAPQAYAALLACADPAHIRSITKTEPFLHISIRGGRARVQPVQSIGPAAPGAPLRCVNVAGFLGQSEHELRAAKPPRDLRIVSIRGDRHEIVLPLTGSIYSETLRKLIRRPGIDRAFLPPSIDELQSCAGKLRAHGRFLDGFNDMFDRSVSGDGDWDTPPDELSGQGPSPFAEDTLTRRMFRNASPATRARLVGQIRDPRLREFARRIVWEHAQAKNIEPPDLAGYLLFKRNRLLGCIGSNWRTISAVRKELDELARKSPSSGNDRYVAASRYLDRLERTARI